VSIGESSGRELLVKCIPFVNVVRPVENGKNWLAMRLALCSLVPASEFSRVFTIPGRDLQLDFCVVRTALCWTNSELAASNFPTSFISPRSVARRIHPQFDIELGLALNSYQLIRTDFGGVGRALTISGVRTLRSCFFRCL
jgi:hypothetical protein